MTASNHFLTGAFIGTAVGNPWIGLPAAVASHFVLDSLPQYGYEGNKELKRSKFTMFQWVLILDSILFLISIWALTFLLSKPELIIYGIAGYSPDIVWVIKFTLQEKFGQTHLPNKNWFTKFHAGIQKLEHPLFIIWEVAYFVALFIALVRLTS